MLERFQVRIFEEEQYAAKRLPARALREQPGELHLLEGQVFGLLRQQVMASDEVQVALVSLIEAGLPSVAEILHLRVPVLVENPSPLFRRDHVEVADLVFRGELIVSSQRFPS